MSDCTNSAAGAQPDLTPLQAAAARELARGHVPVRLKYAAKALDADKGLGAAMLGLRADQVDVRAMFPAGADANIAVLNGAPSANLADVDLDCGEARPAAPHLLPPTDMISGRRSAPDSHYFYRTDPPIDMASEKCLDPTPPDRRAGGAVLVELRGTGGYTVIPPSIAPADLVKGKVEESVVWSADGEPARVPAGELRAAVRVLAAAALLGRYLGAGNRHDPALALAGGLLGVGWKADRVRTFVAAVAAASGGAAADMTAAVDDTAAKLAAGEAVTGWPTLAERLGPDGKLIVCQVRDWLDLRAVSPRPSESSAVGRRSRPEVHSLPHPMPAAVGLLR